MSTVGRISSREALRLVNDLVPSIMLTLFCDTIGKHSDVGILWIVSPECVYRLFSQPR